MNHHAPPTILGLDPGTRFLGAAVVRGRKLLAYGVHVLKNGHRPYDVIGQARRVVFRYIEQHGPQFVAIEAPYLIATERGAVLTALARELYERSKDLGLDVVELSPEKVRQAVTGNALSTKYEVAQRLAETDFRELQKLVPKKPKTPALWLTSRERYWLHMFDALGLAEAAWRQLSATGFYGAIASRKTSRHPSSSHSLSGRPSSVELDEASTPA